MITLNNDSLQNKKNLSVAVIGSSEVLLKKEFGQLIDNHDIVIRCNRANTSDYKKYTGVKTDIRIVNMHLINDVESDEIVEWQHSLFSEYDRYFITQQKNEHIILKCGNDDLLKTHTKTIDKIKQNNEFSFLPLQDLKSISSYSGYSEPSCGLVAIFIAMTYFGNVNVFGFNMETDSWMNHYYEKITPYETTHKIDIEQESVKKMAEEGLISLL